MENCYFYFCITGNKRYDKEIGGVCVLCVCCVWCVCMVCVTQKVCRVVCCVLCTKGVCSCQVGKMWEESESDGVYVNLLAAIDTHTRTHACTPTDAESQSFQSHSHIR